MEQEEGSNLLLKQKNDIIKAISKAYISYFNNISNNTRRNVNSLTVINIMCNPYPRNTCQKCLNNFVDVSKVYPCPSTVPCPDTGFCADGTTHCEPNSTCPARELCYLRDNQNNFICSDGSTPCTPEYPLFEYTRKLGGTVGVYGQGDPNGICASSCQCNLSNVVMENIFLLDDNAIATPPSATDINGIANEALSIINNDDNSLVLSPSSFIEMVKNVVNNVSTTVSTTINQSVYSTQLINLTGGGTAYGIHMYTMVNAVMNAILNSTVSVTSINDFIDEMCAIAKEKVDKDLIGNFAYIFQQGKTFFIATGIVLVALFVIIVLMLFYRAYYGRR